MPIKFCSEAWGCLTSLKSQTRDPQLKVPPRGLVLRIFMSWKNPLTSVGFEPANLGSRCKHITPRPPRPKSMAHSVNTKLSMSAAPKFESSTTTIRCCNKIIFQNFFVFRHFLCCLHIKISRQDFYLYKNFILKCRVLKSMNIANSGFFSLPPLMKGFSLTAMLENSHFIRLSDLNLNW